MVKVSKEENRIGIFKNEKLYALYSLKDRKWYFTLAYLASGDDDNDVLKVIIDLNERLKKNVKFS